MDSILYIYIESTMVNKKRLLDQSQPNRKNWGPIHHRLNRLWIPQRKDLAGQKVLLAFSSGVDSMAGASLMLEVGTAYGLEFGLAYIHHGDHQQKKYRDRAMNAAKRFSKKAGIPFFTFKSEQVLKSEQDFRDFRYKTLRNIRIENGFQTIATFHHLQDQLETRLMHLIRGSGGQGLLGIRERSEDLWRPFLQFEKNDFKVFCQQRNIRIVEDPSNAKLDYKRNWLREKWLPDLERKFPGSVKSFARSLAVLAEEFEQSKRNTNSQLISTDISLLQYKRLEHSQRKKWVVSCLKFNKQKSFSSSQIEEILKQLDIRKKSHIFELAGIRWVVNAGQIQALKLV